MQTNPRKRILLVEDNPLDAELTLSALKANGVVVDVDVVSDGEEALDYLFRRGPYKNRVEPDPALVILDLKMPKLGGAETLQQIKASVQLKCLPVVMLTSSRETQDLRTCYGLGANGYVVKPVDAKHFMRTINTVAIYWLTTNEPIPFSTLAPAPSP
jgi:CheY-like chemotaxis protein